MRVAIIGAGIGGLALARALVSQGHDIRVYERHPSLRLGGAAITLWSNGTSVLHALGIDLSGAGQVVETLEHRAPSGTVRTRIRANDLERRFGAATITLPRSELITRLAAALPPSTIGFGHDLTDLAHDGTEAELQFGSGHHETADLVVGADGARSTVARLLNIQPSLVHSGWTSWQVLDHTPVPSVDPSVAALVVGREGAIGIMPAGNRRCLWWYDLRHPLHAHDAQSVLVELHRRFATWAFPVPELLAHTTAENIEPYPHMRRYIQTPWGRGPITLIGDAAHVMPPSLGQGANQTLQDAHALATALNTPRRDLVNVLRDHERGRRAHTRMIARIADSELTLSAHTGALTRVMSDNATTRAHARLLAASSPTLHKRKAPR